jgi:hypothetical protein
MHFHVGHGDHRVARALEEADRHADEVARKDDVEDLPLAVAQKLVAGAEALGDEAQLAKLVAFDDEIAALLDGQLRLDQLAQAVEIVAGQRKVAGQADDERMPVPVGRRDGGRADRRKGRRQAHEAPAPRG